MFALRNSPSVFSFATNSNGISLSIESAIYLDTGGRDLTISGNVKLLPGLSERLDDAEERDHVLSVLRLVEAEPSLIGMSQNFVAIAALPDGDREVEPGP